MKNPPGLTVAGKKAPVKGLRSDLELMLFLGNL